LVRVGAVVGDGLLIESRRERIKGAWERA